MNKKEIKELLEEFFVDNRNIKKNIMPAYQKVINVMKTKLNHAYDYNEIDLRPSESRIMFEILRFHPDFETKWTKGCKFVYGAGTAKDGKSYSDVFIKSPNGKIETFSKKTIKQHLKKDKNSNFSLNDLEEKFKLQLRVEASFDYLKEEINNRKELGLCTKIFGVRKISKEPNMNDFIFCDYCLARTGYNEFKCSNPLEQHVTIDKKLTKTEYAPGIAAKGDEDDNRFSNYYITKQSIETNQGFLTKNRLIYLIPDSGGEFRHLGNYKKDNLIIDKFSKNMNSYPIYKLKSEHINNFDDFFKSL